MSVCTIDVGLELKKANEQGFQEGYQLGTVHGMNACSDEEFKAEAERRGYRLQKKPEMVKFLPCVCGCKRRIRWYRYVDPTGYSYECENCGLKSEHGKTQKLAKANWNAMIEEKMKDGKD